jgi:hypothetical protein
MASYYNNDNNDEHSRFVEKMTYEQEFYAYVYPMAPYCGEGSDNDVRYGYDGMPLEGGDFRPYVNVESNMSDDELIRNINGMENFATLTSKEHRRYKELESNKDLLDHITSEVRTGDEFTHWDLTQTQEAIHKSLYTQHPGYKCVDVTGLPESFFGEMDMTNYLRYLRAQYHVWYVCYQKEHKRIVIMGGNYPKVQECKVNLQNKLWWATSAGGSVYYDHDHDQLTTTRFERALDIYHYNWINSEDFSAQMDMTEEDYRDQLTKTIDDETAIRDYIHTI